MTEQHAGAGDIRQQIRDCIAHLEHVLPGQAPIRDFVHHNTLHGYQHLGFREAVAAAQRTSGQRGYLPLARFRAYFSDGRIDREDLVAVLEEEPDLEPGQVLLDRPDGEPLRRRDVYLAALLHPLNPVTPAQLAWEVGERAALARLQADLDPDARARLLASAAVSGHQGEQAAVADLADACLAVLGLTHVTLHPEELTGLSEPAPGRPGGDRTPAADGTPGRQIRMDAVERLQTLLDRVGPEITLRGLLRELTGEDLIDQIRQQLVRHFGPFLDEGFAAWRNPAADQGLYPAWRATALRDLTPMFRDLQAWRQELESLPEDPLEAIVTLLQHLGLVRERWVPYLERLALEVPGWSGMFLWRERHPDYARGRGTPVSMLDYLAVRLALERIYAQRLCRETWQIESSLDMLRWYFRRNPEELLCRQALHAGGLPEYLAARAERATARSDLEQGERGWQGLAALIWTWRRSPLADADPGPTVYRHAWALFRLAQHLGLCGDQVRALGPDGVAAVFGCLDRLGLEDQGGHGSHLWLCAFERHYREQVLTALAHNRGRGRWGHRDAAIRPEAQLVFCMDDREEGIRRHLEELAPELETLGAAAHFNVPNNWLGLDDTRVSALAPVIPAPVIPAHEVREVPRPECQAAGAVHARRQARLLAWGQALLQQGRRGLPGPIAASALAGLPVSVALAWRLAAPARFARLIGRLRSFRVPQVETRIDFVAPNDSPPADPRSPRLGFTDLEQADRVQALLRNLGLTDGFAPLVAILGHASRNLNNPHASAYNCGACSGRFSGPNARLVAAMANRPEVREILAGRGIQIPSGTWFVGGERDTCNDTTAWYDVADVPAALAPTLERLRERLDRASRLHAQERCRRFASAPSPLDPEAAHRHVANRAQDPSQVRPELGHATNACAFFGRRAMSRGIFLDRRAFLISYDPTQDPNGEVLERHLVINGAVGAGIALEYYFSAANDEGYGCGSKVTHNVTGLLGVMDGAASDLRTGLPRQMVEVHEAMRLLVVVEQSTAVVTAIYERQSAVRELVAGAWVQLCTMDPQTGAIHRFRPGQGWSPWEPPASPPPRAGRSSDWVLGHRGPRPPALIAAPDAEPLHG